MGELWRSHKPSSRVLGEGFYGLRNAKSIWTKVPMCIATKVQLAVRTGCGTRLPVAAKVLFSRRSNSPHRLNPMTSPC